MANSALQWVARHRTVAVSVAALAIAAAIAVPLAVSNDAPGPVGAPAPTGHYLSLVYDAAKLSMIQFGLGDRTVSLQSLGPVSTLS